jgi:hypothetical protein
MSGVETVAYKRDAGAELPKPEHWDTTGKSGVVITCKHGNHAMIAGRGDGKDWKIDAAGKVTPSVYWQSSCGCHIWLTLEGWPA